MADVAIKKIIHSADYDIRSLDRHSGLRIRGVFDTSIAARFTGATRLGLETIIKDMLGVDIDKSKALQRSDWGRRPLSSEALDYAATDVRHLVALWEILDAKLQTLGRTTWVAEECARIEEVRYKIQDIETAFLSVKGSKDLDERQLAVLRSLFLFREEEAIRQHRPPFFVLPDAALIFLAVNPLADLKDVPGLGQTGLKRFGFGLLQAVQRGITAPHVTRPRSVRTLRPTEEQVQRLTKLKEWRTSLGSSFAIDPSLLWPLLSLERLSRDPGSLSAELTHESIRRWQRDVVASSLQACLKSLG